MAEVYAKPAGKSRTNPRVLEDALMYARHFGRFFRLPPFSASPSTLSLDRDLGKVAGAAFDRMKHAPNDPQVKAAYDQMKKEILAQYKLVTSRGLTVLPWTEPGQPYKDSADLRDAVARTHSIYYFPTKAGFGTDEKHGDHPLNEQVPGMPQGTVYNDLFRAVHDYFGHVMHGHEFGPQGELRAWHEHARMFSPLARKAMTTETHGQNSWVNFGPHDPQTKPPQERPFADQKAGVLPESVHPKAKLARPKLPTMGWWMDPTGKIHDVPNEQTHDAWMQKHTGIYGAGRDYAYERGWHRLIHIPAAKTLIVENPKVRPTPEQATAIKQHADSIGAEKTEQYHPFARRESRLRQFLARQNDPLLPLVPHMLGALRDRKNKASLHVLADHAEETAPNHPLVRGLRGFINGDRNALDAYFKQHGDENHPYVFELRHSDPGSGVEVAPRSFDQPRLRIHTADAEPVYRLVLRHSPGKKLSEDKAVRWMAAQPGGLGNLLHAVLAAHFFEHGGSAEKLKLARVPATQLGTAGAIGQAGSDNHAKRIELAKKVLSEAGFGRAVVRSVLTHVGPESRPGVMAAIETATNPQHALYTAAWMGLLTQQPRMTVFHPGEGEDTLHVITTPHPSDHVSAYLRAAGAKSFSTEQAGQGTRAYVVNGDGPRFAQGLDGQVSTFTGRAHPMEGREAYQQVIRDSEGATEQPQKLSRQPEPPAMERHGYYEQGNGSHVLIHRFVPKHVAGEWRWLIEGTKHHPRSVIQPGGIHEHAVNLDDDPLSLVPLNAFERQMAGIDPPPEQDFRPDHATPEDFYA